MGHRIVVAVSITSALLLAAAPSLAQGQMPRPPQMPPPGGSMGPPQRGQAMPQQRQQAPKPYKAVEVGAPKPIADQSFEAFRKQLADIAQRKDRRALAGLVVARGFFWIGEKGDKADKRRSGIDNLAKAVGLDSKEGDGWAMLAAYAADPTGTVDPDRKNEICAPGSPSFNDQEFEALIKSTGTEEDDWGYPAQAGLEMRASAEPNAPVVEKLGMHLLRVMQDDNGDAQQTSMLKVVAPSGKTGFVPVDAVSALANDQMCYGKEGGAWKIIGFVGGE